MTTEIRELLIRAVGILEGLLFTAQDGASDSLEHVVKHIEKLLGEDNND